MNEWIANTTMNKIQNFISEKKVKPDTTMLLLNAIYFQASWKKSFNPNKTMKADFHIDSESSINIDFMNIEGTYRFISEMWALNGSMAIEIPFTDPGVSMIIIKPGENSTFHGMLECVTKYPWKNIVDRMNLTKMKVSIPKFNITFRDELSKNIIKVKLI